MKPIRASHPAPSDAGAISAALVRGELVTVDEERERLKAVAATLLPRRSTIIETRLKQLTRQRVALLAAIGRASR